MKNQYSLDERNTYHQLLNMNNICGWEIIHNLPTHRLAFEKRVDVFTPESTDSLVKKDKKVNILEHCEHSEYPKELHKTKMSHHFYHRRRNLKKEKLVPNLKNETSES